MNLDELRQKFPITQQYNFQDHACVAPLSQPAADAISDYAQRMARATFYDNDFYRHAEHIRQLGARLVGGDPDEVTFVKNTSEGLCYVANGIQWVTGDNVVSTAMEFPANVYPWMQLEQRGVQLKRVAEDDGRVPFDRLASAIDRRTRLVAVSAVQWGNGFRFDLARLGEMCQEKGVLLLVDAIQALGVHPIDVHAMNIDFLAADAHKWLCGPEGCGLFYCRRELLGHLRPMEIGYLGMKHGFDVPELKIDLRDDARRFDSGAYNVAGICGLGAAVELLLDVGVDEIQKRVKRLSDRLVEGIQSKGWTLHSPRTSSEWSGIVSFSSDKHDLTALRQHLREEFKTVLSLRGGRLRASPHFYNTEEEVDQLIEALPAHPTA